MAPESLLKRWVQMRDEKLRGCGVKRVLKKKVTRTDSFGPILAVDMSRTCTSLWREADLDVKMYKAHEVRTTFRN